MTSSNEFEIYRGWGKWDMITVTVKDKRIYLRACSELDPTEELSVNEAVALAQGLFKAAQLVANHLIIDNQHQMAEHKILIPTTKHFKNEGQIGDNGSDRLLFKEEDEVPLYECGCPTCRKDSQ